jgi:hypothetical protein
MLKSVLFPLLLLALLTAYSVRAESLAQYPLIAAFSHRESNTSLIQVDGRFNPAVRDNPYFLYDLDKNTFYQLKSAPGTQFGLTNEPTQVRRFVTRAYNGTGQSQMNITLLVDQGEYAYLHCDGSSVCYTQASQGLTELLKKLMGDSNTTVQMLPPQIEPTRLFVPIGSAAQANGTVVLFEGLDHLPQSSKNTSVWIRENGKWRSTRIATGEEDVFQQKSQLTFEDGSSINIGNVILGGDRPTVFSSSTPGTAPVTLEDSVSGKVNVAAAVALGRDQTFYDNNLPSIPWLCLLLYR